LSVPVVTRRRLSGLNTALVARLTWTVPIGPDPVIGSSSSAAIRAPVFAFHSPAPWLSRAEDKQAGF
jgi:hypothetical protein